MRKLFLSMAAVAFLFTACNNDSTNEIADEQSKIDMSDFYVYTNADLDETSRQSQENTRACNTMVNLNRQLNETPGLEKKMYDIEYHTRQFIAAKGKPGGGGSGNGGGGNTDVDVLPIDDGFGVINIPVYVHVLYNLQSEIPSAATIQSQMDVLNSDFNSTNVGSLPNGTTFANDATDVQISFTLIATDYKQSSVTDWGTGNNMKKLSTGGINPITPETHLNIWVVNKMTSEGRSILGFAQFPGGPAETDGVVIAKPFFGVTGGNYGGGRTTTHEVGHYLNLRHIWGDGRCNKDDFVTDTPKSDRSNAGCPPFPTTHCRSADMTMNYMDYTYDACMYMFTDGQRNRMRAIFAPGGARATMAGN